MSVLVSVYFTDADGRDLGTWGSCDVAGPAALVQAGKLPFFSLTVSNGGGGWTNDLVPVNGAPDSVGTALVDAISTMLAGMDWNTILAADLLSCSAATPITLTGVAATVTYATPQTTTLLNTVPSS